MEVNNVPNGRANCLRLHIHSEPDLESAIVCKVRYLTDLIVALDESTEDFYKVYTVAGAEGYCKKDQVVIFRK